MHVQDLNSTIGIVCILKINGGAPELLFFFIVVLNQGSVNYSYSPHCLPLYYPGTINGFCVVKGYLRKEKQYATDM